jgi:hypothetical protein
MIDNIKSFYLASILIFFFNSKLFYYLQSGFFKMGRKRKDITYNETQSSNEDDPDYLPDKNRRSLFQKDSILEKARKKGRPTNNNDQPGTSRQLNGSIK